MIRPRTNLKKLIQKTKNQNREYYQLALDADKEKEKKKNLYNYSIRLLIENVKEKQVLKNKPPTEIVVEKTIVKKVPYPVIKKEEVEVIREVEVEVIKKVPVEVLVEVIKEVPVIKEIVKIVEVPVEIEKIVEVEKEVKVFVPTEDPKQEIRHKEELEKLSKKFKVEREQSIDALETRYQAVANLVQAQRIIQQQKVDADTTRFTKTFKRLSTYSYLLTLYSLTQILTWIIL